MKTVEFFYDFGSATAYLAHTQMPGLAKRTGATVAYRPMLLGGVFKATGNQSPVMIPAKGAYMGVDLPRFAKRYGVVFRMNPYFPINTLVLMRGAVAAERLGKLMAYANAVFDAIWVNSRNLNDPAETAKVWAEAGFDPQALFAATQDQSVKDALKASTDEAIARGAFGAPTFYVGSEMFWGQDRIDFVEEALRKSP